MTLEQSVVKEVPRKGKARLDWINEKLEALGVMRDADNGMCARAAIYHGYIEFTGQESDLDQVIIEGVPTVHCCGHNFRATLRQLLEQRDDPDNDYEMGLEFATVLCDKNLEESEDYDDEEECEEGRVYVTGICTGEPRWDSGKFHNHCANCKFFGKCIFDYRNAHCPGCRKHYFRGNSGFPCSCGYESSSDEELDFDSYIKKMEQKYILKKNGFW